MKLLNIFTIATVASAMSLRRQEPISHVEPADTIFHIDPDLLQPHSSFSLSVKVPIPEGGAHYNRLQQRWYVHADPNARRDAESFFKKRSIGHIGEDIAAHGGLEGWTRDPTDVFKYLMRNDSSPIEAPSGFEEYKLVLTPSDVDMLDKALSSTPSLLYKGTAYRKLNVYDQQTGDVAASYRKVGWARIMVKKVPDEEPQVEGAWMVDDPTGLGVPGTVYHISDQESFRAMANADPDQSKAEMKLMKRALVDKPTSMLVWRESDAYTKDLESPTDYSFVTKEMTILSKRQSDIGGGGSSSGLALSSTIGDTSGCPNHKQIALIGAAADCNYMKDFNSTESVRANILANMNTISQLYEQSFNISLGLKALVLANSTDCPTTAVDSAPWNYECTATQPNAISDRLSAFSQWRGDRSSDGIAAWTLFTDCAQGSTVGLSWLGVLCGARASQQGNTWVAGTNVVAKTSLEWKVWAHELGHIFGAVHDCTSQTCSDGTVDKNDCCPMSTSACNANGQWIMNPASGQQETTFSECTKGNICAGIGRNSLNTSCLIDNTGGIKLLTENECGNGIVEEGEDCDCGGEEGCRGNTCCDPKTCKFRTGAVCDDANQACCNQCQFAPSTQECRSSKGPCDPAEFCTGNSSSCPPDLTTENGKSCEDPSRPGFGGLQCIAGLCTSRDLQCFTLMQNRTTLVGNTPANVTQACDQGRCSISCRDPNLPNVCFGSQYNFLDGTPCGRGGKCLRGQCSGNTNDYFRSWFDDAGGWISRNTGAFVGIIVGVVGGIIVLILIGCFRRWRHRKRAMPVYPVKNNYARRAPPPPPPMGGNRGPIGGAGGANMYPPPPPAQYPFKYESRQSQQYPSQDVYPPAAPPPSYSRQCTTTSLPRFNMPRRDRYCADDMAVDTDDDNRDTEMGDSVILSRNRDTRELEDEIRDEDEVLEDDHDGLDDLDDEDDSRPGVSGSGGASGLLRSLAGEMGGLSWHMNFQADRVRELLDNVRQAEDATVMLILLQEISEVLLMSNQDILLYSFPVDNLCSEMAAIMTNPLFEESQDCAIMACRTLYNLWEVSPTVSSNICSAGIAKILADKLTNLTDVDFAEQAMQLLEKLSSDHPESPGHAEHLLRQGCLRAALIHLDFFATHVQRSAVNIAANCCKYLSAAMFDQIQEVMPILANTLTSSDQKVVERGSQAVARTIERLGKSCDEEDVSFEAIVSSELVTQLTALLVHGDSAAQRTVLQTLAIIARHSDNLAAEIVKADITGVLLRILGNSGSEKLLTALVKAPPQLIEECVKLIFSLLPDAVTVEGFPDGPFRTSRASPTRAAVLKQLPNYNSFCSSTLHLLFELFAATMTVRVKRKIVYSVIRLLAASPSETVVALPEVAVFISSVLNQSEDDSLILGAVDMSIFLIENHSAEFGPLFASEGILDQISAIPPPPKSTNKFVALSADSDDDEEDDIVYDFSCNLKPLIALYIQRFEGLVESNSVTSNNNGDLVQIASLLDGPNFKQGLDMLQSRLPTLSTFQLTHSDVVVSLLQSLTVENGHGDLVERRRQFLETFCSNKGSLESFAVLVDKLLEGLARTERFEVLTSGLPDSGNLETTLGKQVRLNLVAERGTDLPKQYRNMFVSIHAIATFKAVDDFFRSKVQTSLAFEQRMSSFMRRRFRGSGGAGGGTLEQALSAIAAATGMPLPSGSIVGEESDSGEDDEDEDNGGNEDDEDGEEDGDGEVDDNEDDDESLGFSEEEEVGGDDDEEIVEDEVGVVNDDSDIEIDETGEAEDGEEEGERANGAGEADDDEGEGASQSYADAAASSGPKWHLTFSINGQEVTHETTVFGALLKACGSPSEIWNTNFTINIEKTKGAPPVVDEPKFESEDIVPYLQSPESFSDSPRAATIMQLLSALYNVNLWSGEIAGSVYNLNPSHFLSSKLTAKFNKQLEEPLIVASLCLPAWTVDATRLYPFLFPFDVRHRYLESTSFGYSRSIQKWEEHYRERRSHNGNDSSSSSRDRNDRPPIGKLIRQKVRISRKHMFQSAIKVMELYGSSPSVLEVEYFDEVGTGLGPTLEFYATVSHQFAHKSLEMWRDDTPTSGAGGSEAFAFSQQGLFPIPLITCSNNEKVLHRFKVLGTFVARSMIDSRLIDIHFSTTFFRLACLQLSFSPTSETLLAIDEQLGKSLRQLQRMSPGEIEHLGLDFTLPGFPQAELKPNGSQIPVNGDNVQEYVDLIVDQTVGSGVSQQIEAFKTGFSEVFPFSAVCAFSPAELVLMCGPSVEDWSLDTLSEAVHADHGFDQRSKTFMNLLEVMSEFDESQRRQFLSFVTGSPKLPIGGFKALKPGLTVVRKASENGLGPDDYLPSVMTCVNYLKCPDFSTKELLRSRLLQAISEGGGAFHLS